VIFDFRHGFKLPVGHLLVVFCHKSEVKRLTPLRHKAKLSEAKYDDQKFVMPCVEQLRLYANTAQMSTPNTRGAALGQKVNNINHKCRKDFQWAPNGAAVLRKGEPAIPREQMHQAFVWAHGGTSAAKHNGRDQTYAKLCSEFHNT
jgi:hypothetical protein